MKGDVEKADLGAAARPVQQYGAVDPSADKVSNDEVEKMPLLLGIWDISPNKLYKVGLAVYVGWFVIQRLADIAYIATVDARFPPGLGHYYPSEWERLESVSYTRQVLLCRFLHRICAFSTVLAFIVFGLFARFDAALRVALANIAIWWESNKLVTSTREWWNRGTACCCVPIWSALTACSCCAWCSQLKERTLNGRLATSIWSLPRLSWRELLIGSTYLMLIGALFYLISAPFVLWSGMIDLRFGFSNPLAVSAGGIQSNLFFGFFSLLIFQIPTKFVFLSVLQFRLGWLFMWSLLMVVLVWAQYNIKDIAPSILDMNNPFPNDIFAVGRNFPWVPTASKASPWISLNRIYFKDPSISSASVSFATNDKSKGPLTLTQHADGKFVISTPSVLYDPSAPVYAQSMSAVAGHVLEELKTKTWTVGGANTRVGVRSGSHLRDELYGFARDRHIGIAQIYMVDGSHKDIRANAFVAGAGNSSVIGLFDTLFLGQRNGDSSGSVVSNSLLQLVTGEAEMQHVSDIVQGVDTGEEEVQDSTPPRNSAPTQAMGDAEIISILAHELGHSALKHLEKGMVVQAVTSFMTFAAMGWMAHSPLVAAALGLHAPLLHVGACAYDLVVGPPLEGGVKLFTDWHTRYNEYEADEYAALISEKYATALQSSLAKLSINSNHDPDVPYFYEVLHDDHPSFSRRYAHIQKVKDKAYGPR